MVYNIQNYWGFWTFSIVRYLENRKHDVLETGSVSVLRWGERETPTQLGPLEIANQWLSLALSKGSYWVGVFPSPEDGNRSSFRNVVFSSLYNTGRWKKSKNLVFLNNIYYRNNDPFCVSRYPVMVPCCNTQMFWSCTEIITAVIRPPLSNWFSRMDPRVHFP
jgi:hypothetical protein